MINRIIALLQAYKSNKLSVTTHSEIAPNRKQDPGPYFDFARLDY